MINKSLPQLMTGAQPLFWKGNEVGCLILHGFMASPGEVGWLGEYLTGQGYTIYVPRLTGHGIDPSMMRRMRWQDWYAQSLDGYYLLQQQCDEIYVIGHSMGGLLALLISTTMRVQGLGVVASPLSIVDKRLYISRLLTPVLPYTEHTTDKRLQKIILDEQNARNTPMIGRTHYRRWYTEAVTELRLLIQCASKNLCHVTAPLLALYSEGDMTVPLSDQQFLVRRVQSPYIQQQVLRQSDHIIFQDMEREKAFEIVGDFIAKLRQEVF